MKLPAGRFLEPVNVSGSELFQFLKDNQNSYIANYRVDQNVTYTVCGFLDSIPYAEKAAFYSKHRIEKGQGRRSAFVPMATGLFQFVFFTDSKDEKLTAYKYEKKAPEHIGDKRVQETANKILAVLSTDAKTAKQIAEETEISSNTVNKIMRKLVLTGQVETQSNDKAKALYTLKGE